MQTIPTTWSEMLKLLENYIPIFQATKVLRKSPPSGWYKCNVDDSSRGNPGRSSFYFCIRNSLGDLASEAKEIELTRNTEAETGYS